MRQGRDLLASGPAQACGSAPKSQKKVKRKGDNHVAMGLQGICSYSTIPSASLPALEMPLHRAGELLYATSSAA